MPPTNELLLAVQRATRILSGSGHIDNLLQRVLGICVEAVGASGGTVYLHDDRNQTLVFRHVLPEHVREQIQFANIPDDYGVAGESFHKQKTIISTFAPEERHNDIEEQTGVAVHSMITVPLMMQDEPPIGVVQLINKRQGAFTENDATVLDTVAAVSTMAYLNWKLTDEATRASTLLGMGKVSHDIGNLAASLYANMSFADMAIEGLRGAIAQDCHDAERYTAAVEDMVTDLRKSVDRIVGYSRLISDLSANRELRPTLALGSLGQIVETAASYLETEARSNRVELKYDIQEGAPEAETDELFVFRIVQNLVGNAIKAVREMEPDDVDAGEAWIGSVIVRYAHESHRHVISVSDSGPGMPKEVADRILAGNARSMWAKGGGSGWGTKIVLELAAALGGEVEIDSEPGRGTTFHVIFPDRS